MANGKKNGGYTPPPSPSKNMDVRNNDIMRAFNDMRDKTRVEVTNLFNLSNTPSVPNK